MAKREGGFDRGQTNRARRQAGVYDRYLLVESRVETPDPGGLEPTITWQTVTAVWGRRRVMRGFERFQQGQQDARVITIFHLAEYVRGLTHEMRITDTERDGEIVVYDIDVIMPPEARGEGQEVQAHQHAD